jgi:hypothetical protein
MLLPMEDRKVKEEASPSILLMSGKELLNEVKKEHEMQFIVVRNLRVILTSTSVYDLPIEIHELLDNFSYIVVDELPRSLPPIRSISNHIELIPRVIFPNKATYRLTPQENEAIKNQVQEMLDKGLVEARQCAQILEPSTRSKKDKGWTICTYSRAINKIKER